ncbi:hypothetical protein ACFLY6_00020 [Candidatus Dependentiae bacterium]
MSKVLNGQNSFSVTDFEMLGKMLCAFGYFMQTPSCMNSECSCGDSEKVSLANLKSLFNIFIDAMSKNNFYDLDCQSIGINYWGFKTNEKYNFENKETAPEPTKFIIKDTWNKFLSLRKHNAISLGDRLSILGDIINICGEVVSNSEQPWLLF